MVSLGKFPTLLHYNALLHKPYFSFSTRLIFRSVIGKSQSEFCCSALKTKRKDNFRLIEMDGSDEFEDDEILGVEDDGEIEGDSEDEVFVPLKNMKEWIENRPSGFGEGKVYDTSIEDKLMEEIEQSRKAQLANVNKLKNNPVKPSLKKEIVKQDKDLPDIQDAFRVRLINLPKKKNIHRDLRLAFKEVRGIVNIVPIVSGNEKTRDPVCRGLAFVDFKYKDEAERFIQNFSGKNISFGKVQKQLSCEMMNSKLPKPTCDQSVDESNRIPKQTILNLDEDVNAAGVEAEVSQMDSFEESVPGELDDADESHETHLLGQWDDGGVINGTSTTSYSNLTEELEVGEESVTNSSSSNQRRKTKPKDKKAASKQRKDKSVKPNSLGSANKLKIRDKAILTDVFSKYGANTTATVKEQTR